MSETAHTSDSEIDDPNTITDAATCLDYLKRREVFLYKMMNDPSHKAMLYFLEVLMNSDSPITVDQLAARFSHKSFSLEMREACGGGSAEGLREFLERYPSLFNVKPNGQVTSVAIELPGLDSNFDSLSDQESCSLKENGQKSMSDNLSDISTSFRNLTPAVNSAYSSKTCPPSNNLQKENAYNRFPPYRKLNSASTDTSSHQNSTNNTTSRLNSTSSLSLVSSQSGSPLNTPSNDHIFGRKKPSNNFVNNNNNNTTNSSNPSPHGLSSGNAPAGRTRPSNIYTPPQLRNLDHSSQLILPSNCELCSSNPAAAANTAASTNRTSSNHPTNHHEITTVASGTCIHCPLLELACHHTHHCTTAHHHTSTHCHCTPTALTPTASSFHHYHHPLHHIPTQTSLRSPPVLLSNFYTLPPMEKLFLESEAVHFFQQKLIKREERWVPIKSLAGHLSQATPEVRAIVGPQLEFRRFLLKHPHVFEVQGELVSVKDPFLTAGLGGLALKRSRDRLSAVHASHSSTNISNSPAYVSRNMSYEKNPRPKSLILPNMMTYGHLADVNNSYLPSSIQRSTNNSNHYRRSAHFAVDNSSTTTTPPARSLIQSDNINSAPTTPTTANLAFTDSNHSQVDKMANEKSSSNPVPRLHPHHQNGVTSSTMTTEYDTSVMTNSLPSTTVNSLSLTMTANEYRAIMFLRKVLEKQGGAVGQSGLSLHNLMQFLSTKAPEAVQTTIGWTKIELEEFLGQHNLFFELKPVKAGDDEKTSVVDSASNEKQKQTVNSVKIEDNIAVCNRRLNRMINIIITASKSSDANGVRTLTNRCGRIFHVAKLWGIIDLGKHEHVFFDKSIFRHVDDLQKHFKIDELLYFNAVLAPKESRAKWRATHVWKECDRENVEKFGALSKMNLTHMKKQNTSNTTNRNFISLQNTHNLHELDYQNIKGSKLSREIATETMDYPTGNNNNGTGNHTPVVDDDDTEVEEEIEDYIVENSTSKDREVCKSHPSQLDNDSDCEYALAGEEGLDDDDEDEDGEAIDSPIAHLPIDIKFIADEVEEEMERVLNIQLKSTTITGDNKKTEDDLHHLSNTTKSSCHELCDSSNSTELSHQTQSEPCRMMTMKKNSGSNTSSDYERHYSLVTSSTGQSKLTRHKLNLSSQDDSGTSSSLSEMNAISIAVQTVSTGDIMATQLYHDNKE